MEKMVNSTKYKINELIQERNFALVKKTKINRNNISIMKTRSNLIEQKESIHIKPCRTFIMKFYRPALDYRISYSFRIFSSHEI